MQLLVGDIEVVTTEEATHHTADSGYDTTTQLANSPNQQQVKQVHTATTTTAKAIQVAETDPILHKATKLDHLCTSDRDYFLLESDTITADEYAKLSLGSETTTTTDPDSHVQQLSSLPHCDDSLSTTVSEESDCTVAVRVYDLNKRETKILRHDIIKRSRNPVGGADLLNTSSSSLLNNLGNCCSSNSNSNTSINNSGTYRSSQEPQENVYSKPPRSPTSKLRSVHLNRNPRKLKMADVQLMNDAFGTSLDPKIIDELKRKNGEIHEEITTDAITSSSSPVPNDSAVVVSVTENLLESERNASEVRTDDLPEQVASIEIKQQLHQQQSNHDEHATDATDTTVATTNDNAVHVLVNEGANKREESNNNYNISNGNGNDIDTTTNTIITTTTISTTTSATSATIISEKNNNISNSNSTTTIENVASIMENAEPLSIESMPLPIETTTNTLVDKSQIVVGTIMHEQKSSSSSTSNQQVKTFERSYEVIVQVNEHKEKSVIEEDVIPALPSVKELARSFSTKRDPDARPEKLQQRPKVSVSALSS